MPSHRCRIPNAPSYDVHFPWEALTLMPHQITSNISLRLRCHRAFPSPQYVINLLVYDSCPDDRARLEVFRGARKHWAHQAV